MQSPRETSSFAGRSLRITESVDPTPRGASSADDARARVERVRADRITHRAWEVGAENHAAAALSTFDTRWVVATHVADALEGGQAAILRPEARSRLLANAGKMGLRPFDANLVIAIVQDAARRGESPRDMATAERIMMVGKPEKPSSRGGGFLLLLSLALSAMWAVLLLRWLTG